MPEAPAARIPDSHRNAFWIYGVTAMVMREPLGLFISHLSEAGPGRAAVQLEGLRVAVVLLFLSRQFLAAGTFFERVYLQPDSAARFPRRSYPVDFLTRLIELLVAVAASTAVGIRSRHIGELSPFTMLTAILLMLQPVWLVVAGLAKYSTVAEIAPDARANAAIFLIADVIYITIHWLKFGPARAEAVALATVILLVCLRLASQMASYGRMERDKRN